MNQDQYFAIIFPLSVDNISRIFNGKKVFCKYIGNRSIFVSPGTKILFYASKHNFEIHGESSVSTVEFLKPADLISKYSKELFINREELESYRGNRSRDTKLAVFVLSNISQFKNPVKMAKPITMAGQTLTEVQYNELFETRSRSLP